MKAFTLVELIVLITILGILWTIAFISLQWYSSQLWEYNITITSNDWRYYYTDYYTEDEWCVQFINRGLESVKLCDRYTIIERIK